LPRRSSPHALGHVEGPSGPPRSGATSPCVGETIEFLADWERFAATHAHYVLRGLFSIAVPVRLSSYHAALAARAELIARIEALVARGERGEDALSVLFSATNEQGAKLTMDDIVDTIITLLFAGYETSSSGLASLCLLLAQHPHVFERLRDELLAADLGGPLSLESVRGLSHLDQIVSYLDQVVKEVLRVIPPVSGSFRRVVNDCSINGYRIPKGWMVL
jgi:retinoid hydroxylase